MIQGKKDNKFAKALDSQNNSIEVNDMVKIIDGPHAVRFKRTILKNFVAQPKKDKEEEKQGEIKHLFRNYAFVYSRKHTENGGIFVCRTKQLLLVGAKTGRSMILPTTVIFVTFSGSYSYATARRISFDNGFTSSWWTNTIRIFDV